MTRVQSEKEKIQSWTKMQQQIWSQFLSLNYEGILFQQGQHSVWECTSEFYKIWTRVQLTEMEVQVTHCYLMGLRPNVRNLVELQPCWTLYGVVQLAMKVENQQRWSNNHLIRSARGPNQLEDNRREGDGRNQWQWPMICRILDQILTSKLATKAKGMQQWEIMFLEIVATHCSQQDAE